MSPTFTTRTTNGTPVWIAGEGPTLVLIHGVMMDHRMWQRQMDTLSSICRVCCFDMLGHGEAPDPPGERSLDDFVDQTREVITELSPHASCFLGGFSMGGLVAQAYGIRYSSSLQGLLLSNTVYHRSAVELNAVQSRLALLETHGIEKVIEAALMRWFSEEEHRTQAAAIEAIMGWMREGEIEPKRKAYRVFAGSDRQTLGQLGKITCPTLIMTGEKDTGSPPSMSRKMAELIPQAELHILTHQRHMMSILAAEHVNTLIRQLISDRVV